MSVERESSIKEVEAQVLIDWSEVDELFDDSQQIQHILAAEDSTVEQEDLPEALSDSIQQQHRLFSKSHFYRGCTRIQNLQAPTTYWGRILFKAARYNHEILHRATASGPMGNRSIIVGFRL